MDAPAAAELVTVVSVLALGAARIVVAIWLLWRRRVTDTRVNVNT